MSRNRHALFTFSPSPTSPYPRYRSRPLGSQQPSTSEHGDGKKEATARDEIQRAGSRDNAPAGTTQWGMFELLIPGVKHAKEAGLGAEILGIASDWEGGRHFELFILSTKL